MAIATRVSSADVGSPTLTCEDGKLYDVLKYALPLLGWTIAFDDPVNFRIAFRNDDTGGLGGFFRIRDKSADHSGTAAFAEVRLFSAMTDVNTGSNQTPATDSAFICKGETVGTTVRAWEIVGDAKSALIMIRLDDLGSDDTWYLTTVGNLEPRSPTDNTFMFGGTDTAGSTVLGGFGEGAYPYHSGTSSNHLRFLFSNDGLSNDVGARPFVAMGGYSGAGANVDPGIAGRLFDPITGQAEFCRAMIADTNTHLRGHLRGMFWPMGDWKTEYGSVADLANMPHPAGLRTLRFQTSADRSNSTLPSFGVLIDMGGDWDE